MAPLTEFNQPHHAVLLFGPALIFLITLGGLAYRAFYGPLSQIPGPRISRWTNWRLKIAALTGERTRYIHSLHQRYGPIVRVTPHEVSLADTASAQMINKVGGPFLKTQWYDDFTGNQVLSIFTTRDPGFHGRHRKLLAANFSEKWVANMEPHIAKNTRLAVARMADESSQLGYTDAWKWFLFMATDVIGEAAFGQSFEMLRTGKKNQYSKDLETTARIGYLRTEFPFLKHMRKIPIGPLKALYATTMRLNKYSSESLGRYYRQLREDPDKVIPTLLTKEYDLYESGQLEWSQLQRDAASSIVAGTDTTATTATAAVWLLAQYPDIEQELVRAVSALPADFTDHDLQQVEILQFVIKETLRLRGPVSQGLPRAVPAGGAQFCGYHVPQGTVCSVQGYSLHRNPSVWTNPEAFDPSRWKEPTKDMLHSYVPFGGGSRICIGMHFASLELRHALANFYRTFDSGMKMSKANGMSEDDMLPMTYFLDSPKGHRCLMEQRK